MRLLAGTFLGQLVSGLATRVSQYAGRRRGASRVPRMCLECVRAFNRQTTIKYRFTGTLSKPSDGLEPSTPSLPCTADRNPSQPSATVSAGYRGFEGAAFATGCHWLRPLDSILEWPSAPKVPAHRTRRPEL